MPSKPLKKHQATSTEASSAEIWQPEDGHALAPGATHALPPPADPLPGQTLGGAVRSPAATRYTVTNSYAPNEWRATASPAVASRRAPARYDVAPQTCHSWRTVTVTDAAVQKSAPETTSTHTEKRTRARTHDRH